MGAVPLYWPEAWDKKTKVQGFLSDVPFFGLRSRTFRFFRKEVEKRTYKVLSLWGNDAGIYRCLCIVSPVVKEYFKWPNAYFIPEDLCDILFWDPTVDWRDLGFVNFLTKELSLPEDFFVDIEGSTYGKFIEAIKNHIQG